MRSPTQPRQDFAPCNLADSEPRPLRCLVEAVIEHKGDAYAVTYRKNKAPIYSGIGIRRGSVFSLCWSTQGESGVSVYRIEQKLGRAFRELKPYPLFPLDEYFGLVVRSRRLVKASKVVEMPIEPKRLPLVPAPAMTAK